jgi:hypothetical protein
MPNDQSILIISPHGMGKSSLVKQASKMLGAEFHDVRLSQCEVGDIKGLPFLNEETRTTEFFKPRWWPRDMSSSGYLFFDELNRANNEVQQAVFEIVLDRRLDGDYLPDGWRVVVAINGDERYQVSELDPALFDRFYIVDFHPEVNEWLDWAEEAGIHGSILQFIQSSPEYLDPPKDLKQGMVYPSRRSWDKFNQAMTHLGLWESKDPGKITELCLGWIGRAAGIRFTEFYLKDFKLISGDDILNKFDEIREDLDRMKGDPSAMATIARGLGRAISTMDKDILPEQLENLKKALRILPREIASSVWMEAGRSKSIRKHLSQMRKTDPDFVKFVTKLYATNRKKDA